MHIKIKRIYDEQGFDEGYRILVDRLWPRGISREKARLDDWWKEFAPSDDLRKWFDHDVNKWDGFKKKYLKELREHKKEISHKLEDLDLRKTINLFYGARDKEHNQAVVLKAFLDNIDI